MMQSGVCVYLKVLLQTIRNQFNTDELAAAVAVLVALSMVVVALSNVLVALSIVVVALVVVFSMAAVPFKANGVKVVVVAFEAAAASGLDVTLATTPGLVRLSGKPGEAVTRRGTH
jgi:hypothetical protein